MIDLLGVGVCIACISYLCCIYTTAFMLQPPSSKLRKCTDRHRHSARQSNPKSQKRKLIADMTSKSKMTNCPSVTSSKRRECPCADRQPIVKPIAVIPKRRRICLITDSFFDVNGTDSDGDCKRFSEGLGSITSNKCSTGTCPRRFRQADCQN